MDDDDDVIDQFINNDTPQKKEKHKRERSIIDEFANGFVPQELYSPEVPNNRSSSSHQQSEHEFRQDE